MSDLQSSCPADGSCLRDAEADSTVEFQFHGSLWSPGMTIFSHYFRRGALMARKILEAMLPKLLEIKDDILPLRWNL